MGVWRKPAPLIFTAMKERKSLEEMFDEVKRWNAAYRIGKPEVDDKTYDARVEALRTLDPDNPWFKSLEPAPVKKERKRKLPIPMKSLDKVKSLAELKDWFRKVAFVDFHVVIMPKFDGLSLLHDELTGEAFSRGGAENEGQDCSTHYAQLADVDNRSENDYRYTYGEFVFSRRNWERHFAGRKSQLTGEEYKSPRNTAAGLLNRDQPSTEITYADFFRYGIDDETMFRYYNSFHDAITDICEDFRQLPLFHKVEKEEVTEELLDTLYRQWASLYYIDGLVIYVNNINSWQRLGRQPNGNPNYAIAYKHPNFTDNYERTVLDVNWKVSKSGALKPTVKIEDVDTGDCIMNNPTGNNARWLLDRQIAKGAKVLVTRSGGVIPKILLTLAPATHRQLEKLVPEKCPSCGGEVKMGSIDPVCYNPECKGRVIAKMMHFIVSCGIEGIGEDTLVKLYDAGHTTLDSLFRLVPETVMEIEGFGPSMGDIIYYEFARIKKGTPISVLMHASDCFQGVGRIKAEKELDAMNEDEANAFYNGTWDMTQPEPGSAKFFAQTVTRQSIIKGYREFWNFITRLNLKFTVPKKLEKTSDAYGGFNVCFSGIRDLSLEERIKQGGGRVGSGVTKKTTHLIVKDPEQMTSKTTCARNYGIPVLTIAQFLDLIQEN